MTIKAPYLPYDKIRPLADEFLVKYNPDSTIPVDIEKIIEFQLDMDIVPYPELFREFGTDGFISNDLMTIYVDEDLQAKYEYRYRFTLAHEIGHRYLHEDIFAQVEFNNVNEWIGVMDLISPDQYSWFERQAYNFAGLILVPPEELLDEYTKAVEVLEESGYEFRKSDVATINEFIANPISKTFAVSTYVAIKRIDFDGLSPFSV